MSEFHEFDCDICRVTYRTDTSEAEMNREFLRSGMSISETGTLVSVCDDCYTAVMKASRGESRG